MNDDLLSLSEIKKKAFSSFLSLSFRQVFLRAINFITINIILLPVLTPAQLGLFDLAAAFITFFTYFSDIGLAGSLIQKKEAITKEDIFTTFSIQTILVTIICILVYLLAPLFGEFYHLNSDAVWLVRILGISFFFASFKVIPSVLQERVLHFQPLVLVEIVETVIFNILLIYFTYNHFGIWAFSYAALARGIVGVILMYIVAPVKIGLGIHKASAKALLSFGIPFQLNSFMALLKDRLVPIIVANIIGLTGFGLISWAEGMALVPLEFIGTVNRITFPVFSRLQDDKKALTKAVESALFVTTLVIFPLIFGLMAILPAFVFYVATKQWHPALPIFYFYATASALAVVSTVFTNTLNAIGKVRTTLKLMTMWTVLTWVLSPLLAFKYGIFGPAIAYFLINLTSVITIILVKRVLNINLWQAMWLPSLASILMALGVYGISIYLVRDKLTLGLAVLLGGLIYIGLLWVFGRNRIRNDLRSLRSA